MKKLFLSNKRYYNRSAIKNQAFFIKIPRLFHKFLIIYKQEIIYSYLRFILNGRLKYYALAVPKCFMDSPLPLVHHTQWCIKPLCFKERTSLKHLRQGLSTSGSVQLSIWSTFGTCQVIYVLAVYINVFCNIFNLMSCTIMPFTENI